VYTVVYIATSCTWHALCHDGESQPGNSL